MVKNTIAYLVAMMERVEAMPVVVTLPITDAVVGEQAFMDPFVTALDSPAPKL
jgi:hypothetical protein